MNTRRKLILTVAAAGVIGLVGACGGSTPPVNQSNGSQTSQPSAVSGASQPSAVSSDTSPSGAGGNTDSSEAKPTGEIWQWALGRDVFTDENLKQYSQSLGTTGHTDVDVQSEGFKLTVTSGIVTAVTLYNDETALGYPGSSSNFTAYRGQLPLNLTWQSTAGSMGVQYGASNQSGGFGTDITFSYTTTDGYDVVVGFVARHQQDFTPETPIHYITVRKSSQ